MLRWGCSAVAVMTLLSVAGCAHVSDWTPTRSSSDRSIAIVDGGLGSSRKVESSVTSSWTVPGLPSEPVDGHADLLAAVIGKLGDGAPSLLDVRVATPGRPATPDSIAQGVDWAVGRGADVVLIALSSRSDSAALRHALRDAGRNGVLVLSSMRNELVGSSSFPADHESVLSVSSVDEALARAATSPRDGDVSAIGVGVDLGGGRVVSGTSIAAASAAAAVVRCAQSSASRSDLIRDAQRRGLRDDRGVPVLRCTERNNQ
ncbi:hypothetical protein EDF31_11163 [Curtobacterium sp. PhB142]|nr:hypothetical protein EDF31_11163 [Curtobacterium sp. PhB142]TCL99838.1 hypothetical protein EDF26_11222 [Curtobacterium sp. PhB134]